jgi:hypothetical protein
MSEFLLHRLQEGKTVSILKKYSQRGFAFGDLEKLLDPGQQFCRIRA